MNRVHFLVFGVVLSVGCVVPVPSMGQNAANPGVPDMSALPRLTAPGPGGTTGGAVATFSEQRVKPLTEGPLARGIPLAAQGPQPGAGREGPAAAAHRTSRDRPAEHKLPNGSRVTGNGMPAATTSCGSPAPGASPPPGRFWVNGYWKRDDKGWYRVPGFWSERKTDRLDYRKDGPPQDRPDDEPGEPPNADCFYIPGQYYPDGDGVVWKKGYWTKAQPGWSWVPAQWVRQPDGWVFQDGYWDRVLEDRGILFTPAEVDKTARGADDLDLSAVYQSIARNVRAVEWCVRASQLQL